MIVYLIAAFTIGFYLSRIPVKFALVLHVAQQTGFGSGSAIFEGRYALRQADRRARGEKKHLPWRRLKFDVTKFSTAASAMRRLLKSTKFEALCAQGRLGLSDAAQTALLCGLLRAAESALHASLSGCAVRLAIEPDFSGRGSAFTIWGMFSISLGNIIRNVLHSAMEFIFGRIKQWTSIPLKIS